MAFHQLLEGHSFHIEGTGDLQRAGGGFESRLRRNVHTEQRRSIWLLSRRARGTEGTTDIDGAAKQRAPVQSLADDLIEVPGGIPQLVHLCHAPREVLEPLGGAAP